MSTETPTSTTTVRTAARRAGLGYLAIFVLAIFANFLAVGAVLDPEDARATFDDLAASTSTFRWGMLAFLTVFLIDLVVAWALYVVFRDVHKDLAMLMAWARLLYTGFLGVALVFAYQALLLVDGPMPASGSEQAADEVLGALQAFEFTWIVGLAVFGIHLILVGRLLGSTPVAPKPLSWLLVVAGTAYLADTVAHIVVADYADYADLFLAAVAIPSVIGELGLAGWLLLVAFGRRPAPTGPTSRAPEAPAASLAETSVA